MNFFDHRNLGNHLLQLCPKIVKHPVCFDLWRLQPPLPHPPFRLLHCPTSYIPAEDDGWILCMSCPQFSPFRFNIFTQPPELINYGCYQNNFITQYLFHLFITSLEGLLYLRSPPERFWTSYIFSMQSCSLGLLVWICFRKCGQAIAYSGMSCTNVYCFCCFSESLIIILNLHNYSIRR